MGEAKRRRTAALGGDDRIEGIKQPSIAAGWRAYREMVMSPQAPDIQLAECQMAFYAGATTLFHSILKCLDPGEDPTDADMERMAKINDELDAFATGFDEKVMQRRRDWAGSARQQFEAQAPEDRLGDGPVQAEYHAKMTAIMRAFDEFINPDGQKTGIVLMTFPFGDIDGGRCNYMSNAARQDVITLMKEMLARFQGQPEMSGRA